MRRLSFPPLAGPLLIALVAFAACSSSSSGRVAPAAATSPASATSSGAGSTVASAATGQPTVAGSAAAGAVPTPGSDDANAEPGVSAAAGAGSPAADACSLLTPTDIQNATGVAFGNPQAETAQQTQYGSYTACTWLQADAPSTTVRVTVWDDDAAYDDAKQQLGDANDLGEIGDRAFSGTLAAVYAVVNGHTLFVQYSNFDDDDATNLPVSVELAEVAATNL